MRKLLFVLLIAIIACNSIETFEQDELVLEGINFKSMWNKVKKMLKQLKLGLNPLDYMIHLLMQLKI